MRTDSTLLHETKGARIGRGCFIDSLDLSDCDLINIGNDCAINEGASLVGHYFKDGHLHFGEVLPAACFLKPCFACSGG